MSQPKTRNEIVSSDEESLILVDADDREVGFLDKSACHDGNGVLHRAFSLFVFNRGGELLVQQRAADKRLWPSYWSNSCCSHPRQGEFMDAAVDRRLEEELGFRVTLSYLYKFEYSASFRDIGTEHELCSVYVGFATDEPSINTSEIDGWQWIGREQLSHQLDAETERFTPWFQMEWQRLLREFPLAITPPG